MNTEADLRCYRGGTLVMTISHSGSGLDRRVSELTGSGFDVTVIHKRKGQ